MNSKGVIALLGKCEAPTIGSSAAISARALTSGTWFQQTKKPASHLNIPHDTPNSSQGNSHNGAAFRGCFSLVMMSHGHQQVREVRGNTHSYDVVRAIEEFASKPCFGKVYNIGSGSENSISIVEHANFIATWQPTKSTGGDESIRGWTNAATPC
jgi:hypothetical protein